MKKQVFLLVGMILAISSYANPFWWGYFSEADEASLPYSGNLGYGSATTIDAAIYIPANHPIVGNGTIKAVRFWLGNSITAINSDITVWISKKLPTRAAAANYSQKISKSAIVAKKNEVELTTPYTVNNEGFYVGYSFSIKSKAYPVMSYYDEEIVPNSFLFRITGENWMDFPAMGYDYGQLALQVLVDDVTLPAYSVNVADFETGYALANKTVNVPVTISNAGQETVNSISYTITTEGNTTEEQSLPVQNLPSFGSTVVNIPFKADAQNKKYAKTLTVTKVNGQPNNATQNSAKGSLITISEKPQVTPVVEEFTGTWCGYCPYGIVGMETASKTFGDKVVLIAAHNGDPMAINDYNPMMAKVSNFPSAFIDRISNVYPSAAALQYYIQQAMNRVTLGEIKASAMWSSDQKTAITVKTQTKFVYNDDNGQYGIAFILVADALKGTTSGWAQSNYLSGGSGDDEMSFWYSAASKVTGLEFNHVAVGAWNIANGVEGSVDSAIRDGEVQNYTFNADITSKSVVQDKSKLTVVALLIDKSTGIIVNAAQTTIKDYDPSGIDNVKAVVTEVEGFYTLDGKRLAAPAKGMNVVRMSDGTARKVIIR